MKPITTVFPELTTPKKVIIIMHQNPDLDAMGSSLALYHFLTKLGHKVTVASPTIWPKNLDWMPGSNQVLNYENRPQKIKTDKAIMGADWLFCLDFNNISRTQKMASVINEATCTCILIDHHEQPQTEFFHYGVSEKFKSSTCEMVYDLIMASGHGDKLDIPMMECLYAGVVGDTGSFRYESTTESVHRMAAEMKSRELNHTPIHNNIYDNSSEKSLHFLGYVLYKRIQIFYQYNTALISISKADLLEFDAKPSDTGGLMDYLLSIKGIQLAAVCIEEEKEIRWRFRSKDNFDVSTFARTYFGGGGHYNAAGGRSSSSLRNAIEKFIKVISENSPQLKNR